MSKIDFNSDSAPFSGAVLPTIEDVAALSATDGREEVAAHARAGDQLAARSQALLTPVSLVAGGLFLVFFYLFSTAGTDPNATTPTPPRNETAISFEGAKDVRFIRKTPDDKTVKMAAGAVKLGKKVFYFFPKGTEIPASWKAAGIEFYPVERSQIGQDGVLIDGYRWFPLYP